MLRDQSYTPEKCFKACESTDKCGGFSIESRDISCHLYKDGCTRNVDAKDLFTFFSMNDCKGNEHEITTSKDNDTVGLRRGSM